MGAGATLYDIKGVLGGFTVDAEIHETDTSKFETAREESVLQIRIKALDCVTGDHHQIYLKRNYQLLFSTLGNLESVEIVSLVDGKAFREGFYPKGTDFIVTGILEAR